MLNENEISEIKKFFLKALSLSLSDFQSRTDTLRTARNLPNEEISQQSTIYHLQTNDMRTIYAAFQTSTVKTQSDIKITEQNIDEITNVIHDYQNEILPQLLNGYDPKVSTIPWRTIKANIALLDQDIKIKGFTEKYSTELKLAGIGLGIVGLAMWGIFAASSGDVDTTSFAPTPLT